MNIYCVAHWKYFDKAVPEKALFKLVNYPPICWEWECVVPSIRYEDLIISNTFFCSDRLFTRTDGLFRFEDEDLEKVCE